MVAPKVKGATPSKTSMKQVAGIAGGSVDQWKTDSRKTDPRKGK